MCQIDRDTEGNDGEYETEQTPTDLLKALKRESALFIFPAVSGCGAGSGPCHLSMDRTASLFAGVVGAGDRLSLFLGGRMLLAFEDPSHVLANRYPVTPQGVCFTVVWECDPFGWVGE